MKGQPRTAGAHPSRGRLGRQRPRLPLASPPLADRVRLFAAQPTSPGGGAGARGSRRGWGGRRRLERGEACTQQQARGRRESGELSGR